MRNTVALLASFALFTTGSAAAATCVKGGSTNGQYCLNGKDLGTCATDSTTCTALTTPCNGKLEHAPCGDLGSKTLVGYCSAAGDGGACQTENFVKITYSVRTPTNEDGREIREELQEPTFNAQLALTIDRPVKNQERTCTAIAEKGVPLGKFSCPTDPAVGCTLACTTPHENGIAVPHNFECKGSTWEGTAQGSCAKRCPYKTNDADAVGQTNEEGTISADNQVVTYTKKVTNGEVICKNQQGVFGASSPPCTLKCKDKFRASSTNLITFACKGGSAGSPAFTGSLPTCVEAHVVQASVNVALKDDEEFDDIKDSKAFKDSFKSAVAANFDEVAAHHVRISGITEVARRRRLIELNNVDGTHSPEDDGGLPVGGGLRGIR